MNLIEREISRQARGICAIASVIGWPLTCALLVLCCTLVALAFAFRGPWIAIAGGICVLLAIRAHDMGEDDEERTELDCDFSPAAQREREEAFLAEQQEELAARDSQAKFLSNRSAAALGRDHDGREL